MSEIAEFTRHLGHYLQPPDVALVERAFAFSEQAHQGQFRKSGEPYISHPLAVASILSQWRLDAQGLAAALLHDVMEDSGITKNEIETSFGKPVAEMVDGVSKLDQIEFQTREDAQAENFRKMLLAMAQDVRVILIKLADRLHNMRTLDAMAPTHRERIARETLDIYAPIANRLGLNALYLELQELSFKHLHPARYRVLAKAIKAARGNRREVMNRILQSIRDGLKDADIAATVSGREKTIYSVYKKMREKRYTFSQVFDIYGVRVLVKDTTACYAALGVLHNLYKPIPGKFKDYVAIPKANGYQSLHTTLFGPFGTPLEAQIRTQDMHRIAESGVAAHWLYKAGGELDIAEAQEQTHRWLQSLLEIQSESRDSKEFLEHVKGDLFPDAIYVFTPKGKIMALPLGATPVDFAYAVHTDIGHHCTAARINYELMPLRTELKNGDQVEIITSASARPNPSWLGFVATGKARSRIRHFLKSLQQRESALLGERMLEQALTSLKVPPASVTWERWEALAREYGAKGQTEILADIGLGKRLSFVVAQALTRSRRPRRRRAGADACQARRSAASRCRGRRDPVRQVLPADPGGRDHRPFSPRAGPDGAYPRLHHAQEGQGRQRSDCRRRMGAGDRRRIRSRHPAAGGRRARPARASRHGHRGRRCEHRISVDGAARRGPCRRDVLQRPGARPQTSRQRHAGVAPHPRGQARDACAHVVSQRSTGRKRKRPGVPGRRRERVRVRRFETRAASAARPTHAFHA